MSTTTKHTPLEVRQDTNISDWWMLCDDEGTPVAEVRFKDHAVRLQQCHNACAGIPDPLTAIPKLIESLETIAAGMGNLPLMDHGPAGVNGINDGKQRAIYLERFVKVAQDALAAAKPETTA